MKAYPTYREIVRARLQARREAASTVLRAADATARAAGARLIVFGSLVEGGFHQDSDLDLAIFGLPAGRDTELAVELDTAIRLAGFSADVVPERFLPLTLRERIARHGRPASALG